MLRAIFIGTQNPFDEMLVHWLAQRTTLAGVVWTASTDWQRSLSGRLAFARKRARRHGPLKLADEMLFYLHFRRFVVSADHHELTNRVINPYWGDQPAQEWTGDAISATDVNSPAVLDFLAERQPDLILAMCVSSYFGKRLRAIPRHGVFLWHEGITPEYRGLYSPFWAVHNLDFARIGYTLLRMNDQLDGGEVFVQGQAQGIDPFRHAHNFIGHKAIADSLPAVDTFLSELAAGAARPLPRSGAHSAYYSYPGLSDLIRQKIRLRRAARTMRRSSHAIS